MAEPSKKWPLLGIGEVVKRSGVAASALRFYEERGLIASVRGDVGARRSHRRYPRAVLRRIAFIVFAQRIGLSLDEVAVELARLPEDRAPSGRDWSRISKTWDARIGARIAELERLRVGLTACIGCGCLSLDLCPYANPADRAAAGGPGPRYWLGDVRAPAVKHPGAKPAVKHPGEKPAVKHSSEKKKRRLT
jgi:MerR family redox-sensitive transcriptional activator SoxR